MSKASLKRVHRKHKAKRKKRLNFLKSSYFYRFFVLFSFILTIFYLFYFSPYFQIQKIEIRESKTFSSEELKKIIQENYGICFEFLGKKFDSKSILLPFNKAALLLEHFPQIEDIVWRRKFPNVLTLEVKERIPFALWCKNEEKDCHLVDKKGKAFEMFEKENIDKLIIIEEKNEIDSLIPRGKMEKEDFLSLTLKIKEELDGFLGICSPMAASSLLGRTSSTSSSETGALIPSREGSISLIGAGIVLVEPGVKALLQVHFESTRL